jgi:signal transduction histidine kinase
MTTPHTLLLVDDDDIDRESVRRLLEPPFVVREAATGKEALALAQQQAPDCVLLDYRLPDTDGIHLMPHFTQAYVPVIILTGEESPEVIVQAMQQGAQDYLVKSYLSRLALEHAITNAIEKMLLQRGVAEMNQQLRALASELTLAEQRERRRISQILHDNVQQMLYGMQMRSHLIGLDAGDAGAVREHVQALDTLLNEAIQITRTLTTELSPPALQQDGLNGALQWLTQQMADVHGLRIKLILNAAHRRYSDDLSLLLFQLVRELLFNVVKHAGVTEAIVETKNEDNHLVIIVRDAGRGFDATSLSGRKPTQGGFGLFSIRERLALFSGRLVLDTQPGNGVQAKIIVPQTVGLAAERA